MLFFFFKQKTAYEMRISDWSSDVCSSDLQAERRVVGHQVAAAFGAILALAEFGLLERREVIGAGGDPHRVRFPQAEGVDRTAEPGPARCAMAIAHALRLADDFQLDRAAEATSNMAHGSLPCRPAGFRARGAPASCGILPPRARKPAWRGRGSQAGLDRSRARARRSTPEARV